MPFLLIWQTCVGNEKLIELLYLLGKCDVVAERQKSFIKPLKLLAGKRKKKSSLSVSTAVKALSPKDENAVHPLGYKSRPECDSRHLQRSTCIWICRRLSDGGS